MEDITSAYKRIFAFLPQRYWCGQDEYNDMMMEFYDKIINNVTIFQFEPQGNLTLYDQEWTRPRCVDDTIDDLDEDEDNDAAYICNWCDDEGSMYFTLLTKDSSDGDVRCQTRSLPMTGLDFVPEKIVDSGWKPFRLRTNDVNERIYIWESPVQSAYDFIDLYKAWVTHYPSDDSDESS